MEIKDLENKIFNADCLEFMKNIPDKSVDLILTDPPYLIENTKAGDSNKLCKTLQKMNDQLMGAENLINGITNDFLYEMIRIMKKINIYIWCNHKQIPQYFDVFLKEFRCNFDILIWNKTNATPLFYNKYLTDKEYCLYFKRGGLCSPKNYEDAKTVFYDPINVKDKNKFEHPTIKPINFIKKMIKNSSNENDLILDPFLGSGTTAIAAIDLKRRFIGIEKEEKYFNIAKKRIEKFKPVNKLF